MIPTGIKLAITGHREERIPNLIGLRIALTNLLEQCSPSLFIQGMANGVDLNSGVVALKAGIPVMSAKPWAGHTARQEDQYMYDWVWNRSEQRIVDEAKRYPGPWVYHKRNEYMVDHADALLACWDGSEKGGTYACLQYALRKQKPVYRLHMEKFELTLLSGQ